MADFYSVIARAVLKLDHNDAQARQVLYARARATLVTELQRHNPSRSTPETIRIQSMLESAITRVEGEFRSERPQEGGSDKKGELNSIEELDWILSSPSAILFGITIIVGAIAFSGMIFIGWLLLIYAPNFGLLALLGGIAILLCLFIFLSTRFSEETSSSSRPRLLLRAISAGSRRFIRSLRGRGPGRSAA